MPKVASSISQKLQEWIGPYNKNVEVFTSDGKIIFCNVCSKSVGTGKKYFIDAHVKTESHIRALSKNVKSKQTLLTIPALTSSDKKNEFYEDLCGALLGSNIPFYKVNAEPFKQFLEKYTSRHVPDESTLRKTYLPTVFRKKMENIKTSVGNSCVYLIVDETTDSRGFYIANLLVGVLDTDEPQKPFLIACKRLPTTNFETICQFINKSLTAFSSTINERVLLLLTDAAPYMVKAAKTLKVFYPNLLHVTCLAHGINRVAEVARELCPGVNKLVNNGKKAFLKAPSRVAIYKEIMPDSPLPPEPIITRWGTWLEAAIFYANNYEKFAAVVRRLEDDAESVKKLKLLIEERSVQNELIFIKTHLCFLPECLKQLENQGMSLYDSISIVQDVKSKIIRIPGEKGKRLKSKLDNVLEKNVGFKTLEQYSTILTGDGEGNEDIKVEMIPKFKYAPITSVDVERSFSIYKHILDS